MLIYSSGSQLVGQELKVDHRTTILQYQSMCVLPRGPCTPAWETQLDLFPSQSPAVNRHNPYSSAPVPLLKTLVTLTALCWVRVILGLTFALIRQRGTFCGGERVR